MAVFVCVCVCVRAGAYVTPTIHPFIPPRFCHHRAQVRRNTRTGAMHRGEVQWCIHTTTILGWGELGLFVDAPTGFRNSSSIPALPPDALDMDLVLCSWPTRCWPCRPCTASKIHTIPLPCHQPICCQLIGGFFYFICRVPIRSLSFDSQIHIPPLDDEFPHIPPTGFPFVLPSSCFGISSTWSLCCITTSSIPYLPLIDLNRCVFSIDCHANTSSTTTQLPYELMYNQSSSFYIY